ncbi:A/G-specific adenine glycosylase [Nocardioides seonyuensis]|uniref:A/G-specific adenine glycosylase n=1 Tax=Nocardioides seonyuensis TaxID=2518371 RepID=UPI001FC9FB58|nr:A/G-specific adenine glycosylase [Nocardioides seonyuensis]
MNALLDPILRWYDAHARDLPWRRPEASAWSVMVSEFMLQQTPVARVLPVHAAWLERWPSPADLAAETTGEAVRLWGRLGYPRRALRLHAAATAIVADHDGEVPSSYDALRELPGVGDYTASAIAAFAFGQALPVLDTNVRRVHQRVLRGTEFPSDSVRAHERRDAEQLLPDDPATAASWSVAVMELGALVCTARTPACEECPIAGQCSWRAAGYPAYDGPPRRGQAWDGTDRQCRGRIMAVLRGSDEPVHATRIEAVWPDAEQRERCLASLTHDRLVVQVSPTTWALP